jgi:hypothetical protein
MKKIRLLGSRGRPAPTADVAEFIKTRGVTRCPTAACAPTAGAKIDTAALAEHHAAREENRDQDFNFGWR